MKITGVRIYPADQDEGLREHYLDQCFMIRDFKIIRNDSGGSYVAMLNRRQRGDSYPEIAYPSTAEARRMIGKPY